MSDTIENLLLRAFHARKENRLEEAKHDLVLAVEFCRNNNARSELASALTRLGQVERDLRCSDAAREHYEEAVAIYRSESNEMRLAHALRHLGDIHQEAGRRRLADICYREALGLYRADERTHPLDLANAIRGLAILKDNIGDTEYAKTLWQEARHLYQAAEVQEGVAESTRRLARLAAFAGSENVR